MSDIDPNAPIVTTKSGEFVALHEACTLRVNRPDGYITLADKCYELNCVSFDREEIAALLPLLTRYAETGSLANASPPPAGKGEGQ